MPITANSTLNYRSTNRAASTSPLLRAAKRWLSYRRTVRELSRLEERDLADIGLTRSEIRDVGRRHAGVAVAYNPLTLLTAGALHRS